MNLIGPMDCNVGWSYEEHGMKGSDKKYKSDRIMIPEPLLLLRLDDPLHDLRLLNKESPHDAVVKKRSRRQ